MRIAMDSVSWANYWFTDRIAGEDSTLSPEGLLGDAGNPAKGAGEGVGFGSMRRDIGQDSRKPRRVWKNEGAV